MGRPRPLAFAFPGRRDAPGDRPTESVPFDVSIPVLAALRSDRSSKTVWSPSRAADFVAEPADRTAVSHPARSSAASLRKFD